jgi:hypothetical protein
MPVGCELAPRAGSKRNISLDGGRGGGGGRGGRGAAGLWVLISEWHPHKGFRASLRSDGGGRSYPFA